jgi:hypothetical protein
MDTAVGKGSLQRLHEVVGAFHPAAVDAIGLGLSHKIGIAEG